MKISFLIVNLDGEKSGVLKKCLQSLKDKAPDNSQIIVCDNGSKDRSIDLIKKFDFKDIKIIENTSNIGPSKARNDAIKFIKHEITFILDNDAYLNSIDFEYLKSLYYRKKKLAIVQPLIIIDETNKVDYFGDYLTWTGFVKQKHEPLIEFNNIENSVILSAKAAAMIIRTSSLKEIGGFDPFYYIFVEETDLGWKCWLNGFFNITEKKFVVNHGFGSTRKILEKKIVNKNSYFYGPRNYVIMLFTNLELLNLLIILPVHVLLWIGFSIYCLVIRLEFYRFFYQLFGLINAFYNIKTLLIKRKVVQSSRKINDKKLFKSVLKKFSICLFIKKAARKPNILKLRNQKK